LADLEKEFDKNVKIAIQNRDRSQMSGMKIKIKKIIPPIRYEVFEHEKVLNEALESILTEKQNNKWLKYQKQHNPNSTTF
jgi:preprotein translocase subunit Sec63